MARPRKIRMRSSQLPFRTCQPGASDNPKSKREFGYYVMPFMHNGQIVARVDLANRRQTGVLEVLGAFCEPSYDRGTISKPLWEEISLLATFVGCSAIKIKRRGNLSQPLIIEQKMTK